MESDYDDDMPVAQTSTSKQTAMTRVNKSVGQEVNPTWHDNKQTKGSDRETVSGTNEDVLLVSTAALADPSSSSYVTYGGYFHAEVLQGHEEPLGRITVSFYRKITTNVNF